MGTNTFCDICKKQKEDEKTWNKLQVQAYNLEHTLNISGITQNLDLCSECGIILIPKIIKLIKEQKK